MPILSFKRNARLREGRVIASVFRNGRKITGRYVSVIWKAYSEPAWRVACCIVVGRRVSRKAVERNRLRRLLRSALRSEVSRESVHGGGDLIVVAHKRPDPFGLQSVVEDVRTCLKKLGNL